MTYWQNFYSMSFNVYEFVWDFEDARGRGRINGLNHLKPQISIREGKKHGAGEVLEVIRDRRIAAREGDDLQDGGRRAMMFALDVVALEKNK